MSGADDRLLMIGAIARLLEGCRHVAVGAASPVPAAGALLARELTGGRMLVSLLGSERQNPFTDGGRELFDCAAQGRIDAFFFSGVQIAGNGDINLLGLGQHPNLTRRFAGCFGSSYLAFLVPRIILFREEHSRRSLVERVDFVSAPGSSPDGVHRQGGPTALLTNRCLFRFADGRFQLASLHPGHTLDEVREHTGFAFAAPETVGETIRPDRGMVELIRGPVVAGLRDAYPRFVERFAG
jgi:glutaconate CoA-transferase, subunit B